MAKKNQVNFRMSDEAKALLLALCKMEVRNKGAEVEFLVRKEAEEKGVIVAPIVERRRNGGGRSEESIKVG